MKLFDYIMSNVSVYFAKELPAYKPVLCGKNMWNIWMGISLSVCSKGIQ